MTCHSKQRDMATKEKDEKKRALEYFRNLSDELEKSEEMLRIVFQSGARDVKENETYTGEEVIAIVKNAILIATGLRIFDDTQEAIDDLIDLLDDDSDE